MNLSYVRILLLFSFTVVREEGMKKLPALGPLLAVTSLSNQSQMGKFVQVKDFSLFQTDVRLKT
jgi:hypothetical protein